MKFENIYQFFQNTPSTYLSQEQAVCYVLSVLLQRESYGTELIRYLKTQYPDYKLSDTILHVALRFLESQQVISSYWKKVEGRGRPRRMFQIAPQALSQATALAHLWQDYTTNSKFKLPQANIISV